MQTLLCSVCKNCRNESIHFEQTAISNEELENCFNFFGPIFFWLVRIHKLNVWYHRRPPGCQFYSSDWFSFFGQFARFILNMCIFFNLKTIFHTIKQNRSIDFGGNLRLYLIPVWVGQFCFVFRVCIGQMQHLWAQMFLHYLSTSDVGCFQK